MNTGTLAATALQISEGNFTGTITGAGVVQKIDSGTLALSGASTYTGGTDLENGTLLVGNNSALGTGDVALGNGDFGVVSGTAVSLANNVSVLGDVNVTATATLVLGGSVDLGADTRTRLSWITSACLASQAALSETAG